MTPTDSINSLFEKILTAHEMLLKDQIIANTVVLNGNKFAKWVKPGYRPTIFGMAVEYDNLPEDIDFFVQYKEPKPMTNADRIRTMSDEELANWLNTLEPNNPPQGCDYLAGCNGKSGFDDCIECWINWLGEEANE